MTSITNKEILYLAKLSKIKLSEDEIKKLEIDLKNIIEYFGMLSDLDTDNIEPTYEVTDLNNVYREDEVSLSQIKGENLLELAYEIRENSIKIPKVL